MYVSNAYNNSMQSKPLKLHYIAKVYTGKFCFLNIFPEI